MTVKTKERFASVYMIKIFQLLHTASSCCEKVSLTLAFERLSRFRIFVKSIVKAKMFKPKDDLLPPLQNRANGKTAADSPANFAKLLSSQNAGKAFKGI